MICLGIMAHSNRLAKAQSLVEKGVWNRILAAAQEQAYAIGKLNLETVAVDSKLIDSKKAASRQGTTDLSDAME